MSTIPCLPFCLRKIGVKTVIISKDRRLYAHAQYARRRSQSHVASARGCQDLGFCSSWKRHSVVCLWLYATFTLGMRVFVCVYISRLHSSFVLAPEEC